MIQEVPQTQFQNKAATIWSIFKTHNERIQLQIQPIQKEVKKVWLLLFWALRPIKWIWTWSFYARNRNRIRGHLKGLVARKHQLPLFLQSLVASPLPISFHNRTYVDNHHLWQEAIVWPWVGNTQQKLRKVLAKGMLQVKSVPFAVFRPQLCTLRSTQLSDVSKSNNS